MSHFEPHSPPGPSRPTRLNPVELARKTIHTLDSFVCFYVLKLHDFLQGDDALKPRLKSERNANTYKFSINSQNSQ